MISNQFKRWSTSLLLLCCAVVCIKLWALSLGNFDVVRSMQKSNLFSWPSGRGPPWHE